MVEIFSSGSLTRFTGTKQDILQAEAQGTLTIGKWYDTKDHRTDPSLPLEYYYAVKKNKLFKFLSEADVIAIARANNYVKSVMQTNSTLPVVDANGELKINVKLSAAIGQRAQMTSDGLLVSETPDYVRSTTDTNTVALGVDGNGQLSANVRVSNATRNAFTAKPDGGYVPALSVHSSSANYLKINALNEISLSNAALVDKHDATALVSLAEFVSDLNNNKFIPATDIGAGDLIIFKSSIGNYQYVGAGVVPFQITDFHKIESPADAMSDSFIRSRMSAGAGWAYDPTTGIGSARHSTDAGNHIRFGADGGNYLNVGVSDFVSQNGGVTITKSTQDHVTGLHTRINDLSNQVVVGAENGLSIVGQKTRLGGKLDAKTVLDLDGKELYFKGDGAVFIQNRFIAAYKNVGGKPVGAALGWVREFLGENEDGLLEPIYVRPLEWTGINGMFDPAYFGSQHSV